VFPTDVTLDWAGRGDPVRLGLTQVFEERVREGEIYVGLVNPDVGIETPTGRIFCIIHGDAVTTGPVPEGWQPP
jgi:hypothetical protein